MQARKLRLEDAFTLNHGKATIDVLVVTESLRYPTFCLDGSDGCMYETIIIFTPKVGEKEYLSSETEIPWKTEKEAVEGHKRIVALLERTNPEELVEWVPRISEEKVNEILNQILS